MAKKTFLDLPMELKQMIFDNLIQGVKIRYDVYREQIIRRVPQLSPTRSKVVAIMFVSKQAYADFLPILLRSASINVDDLFLAPKISHPVFARLEHIKFNISVMKNRVPLDGIDTAMPNLISVTVRKLSGATFKVYGSDKKSKALLDPQLTNDAAHKLWSKILRRSKPNASSNFKVLVNAWKRSGKKFRLIVQPRVVRVRPLMKKVNALDGFLDLEAKTLEIKEDEGTFKILVRLHDDTPDV